MEPVGRFLRDGSPFRICDMAGSVAEWCRGWAREGQTRPHRGGSWSQASIQFFRCAYRSSARPDLTSMSHGIRLVARPRG